MPNGFGNRISAAAAAVCLAFATLPASAGAAEVRYGAEGLPGPVGQMRDAITDAARTGEIGEMLPVLESNELPPLVSNGPVKDAIEYWKKISGDGHGRDILAAMLEVLEAGYVRLKAGQPDEIYVWPYFAEIPLDRLTGAQEVELYRLVPPADARAMREKGRYSHYRIGIGGDGTWHYFLRDD